MTVWDVLISSALGASYAGLYVAFAACIKPDVWLGFVCFGAFVSGILFTKLIPESYALAESCGLDAVWSGLLVGAYPGAFVPGYLVVWKMLQDRGPVDVLPSEDMRKIFGVAIALLSVGALCFAVVLTMPGALPMWHPGAALLISRVVMGIGGGMFGYAAQFVGATTGPPEQWAVNAVQLAVVKAAGAGVGPMLASLSRSLRLLTSAGEFQFWDDAILCMILCMAGFRFLPRSSSAASAESLVRQTQGSPDPLRGTWSPAILAGAALCCLRTYVMSGAEVTTALILENNLWTKRQIGLAVGIVFLSCILIKFGMDSITGGIRERGAVVLLAGALFATVLMSRSVTDSTVLGAQWGLLTADMLLLPQLIVFGGFVDGVLLSLPRLVRGAPALNDVQLLRGVCTDGIGRLLGPPTSRWVVSSTGEMGQDAYSLVQFLVIVLMLLMATIIVFPGYLRAKAATGTETEPQTEEETSSTDSSCSDPEMAMPIVDVDCD
mmetsp:Transcript_68692/g.190127  ORF Transcript_68692/g.190127 Transcript_68692/m.190127 type:complete len:493 (+) Transcript_68692:96-1574(+)